MAGPLPGARDIADDAGRTAAPEPGSLWVTARAAAVGEVVYERLAPVLVGVVEVEDVAGTTWLHAVPFGIDEDDARADEVVVEADESTLGMRIRFATHHRLRLRPAQLERVVGQLDAGACDELRAAGSGDDAAGRRGTAGAQQGGHGAGARPEPAVLMVLQEPWWRANGEAPR